MAIYPSLIHRLKNQHEAIANILSTTESSRLLVRPQPNKWNIHDNIVHLTTYQLVFIDRMNQILSRDMPSFDRYVADEDQEFKNYRTLGTSALLNTLRVDREAIYTLITTLTDTQINRVGIHKKFGPLTIAQWAEFFLLHEAHHIFTIFQLAHDVDLKSEGK